MAQSKKNSSNVCRVLLIEAGSELEAGIPPNVAVLVSAIITAGHDVKVFSTNDYQVSPVTGDMIREQTLQVPPCNPDDMVYKPKPTDMVEDFLSLIDEYQPQLVGLSTTEATWLDGLKLLNALKEINLDAVVIVGGTYPTLCPDEVISESAVDIICIGEGEESLVMLCDDISRGERNLNIPNFWFKNGQTVVKNDLRPLINIDDVPLQNWTPWSIPPRAAKIMAGQVSKTALVELTRGCPYKCSYCANQFLNDTFVGNYREKTIDKFIKEVEHLKKLYDIRFIYVGDETIMTTSNRRFKEFLEKYAPLSIPFWCQTVPEVIKHEKVKGLMEVGLKAINVGIESGNPKFRKNILNRPVTNEKIVEGIQAAVTAGTRVGANVIIGFPGETRSQIIETIELVREAKPTSTMIHLYQPYRGTPLREECVKLGIIDANHICGDYRFDAIGTGILSADELKGIQRVFNLYVSLPKDRWQEISEAEELSEQGNKKFAKLAREYQMKHWGKTSF
ncbi:MAG: B12-binding domain-containing radical SAM protein [Magnetococcales bacterium]|nr:B12-binding domain-containing radical SAM protein [Magnetococcales bacterium]